MSQSITDILNQNQQRLMRGPGDMGQFVQGTVTENNDKKFPAMVRVEFTSWERGKNICEWIPILHTYAGDRYGQYLLPEIGDVVLIGFLGSAQTKPFVMGVLYPADSSYAKECFEKKNLTKRFKTKGGVDFTVSDEDKKETITVTTPKGLTVEITDEKESILIADKDKKNKILINCKDGGIEIEAEKTIDLKTGKCEISMDGKSGTIVLKANKLNLDAKQTAKLAAKQSLTLEGGMLKAEGKQTASIKGGTMTQVQGQIIKLN